MSVRKLIPLTDDIRNCKSLFNIKTWQHTVTPVDCEKKPSVRALVTKWNGTKDHRKGAKNSATNERPDDKVGSEAQSSGGRHRKTIAEQKELAQERERKALENCRASERPEIDEVENFEELVEEKERSRSPKGRRKTGWKPEDHVCTVIDCRDSGTSHMNVSISRSHTDLLSPTESLIGSPRTTSELSLMQEDSSNRAISQQTKKKRIKVYQCGDKIMKVMVDPDDDDETAEIGDELEVQDSGTREQRNNCCRHISLKNPKLKILTPRRKQASMMELSLGKPYGIQLGAFSIASDSFPDGIRGNQALDVLLVAHGMTYSKRPVQWTQRDIDNILQLGTELHIETSHVSIKKLSQLSKGFTHKCQFIQVTMSEPIVVGKVMTMSERSMDLLTGLEKFFTQHKQGILKTPELDLYIMYRQAFFVFDPRGRTIDCESSPNGEAALMVLANLHNVYHLILNLSKINIKSPFKISTVEVTQMMNSENSPEKFTAASGNPSRVCRTNDFKVVDDNAAYLRGSLHLGSGVFGMSRNKHHLTTAIMAMVYAKIDPPNSWSSSTLDRVLHFGSKLYSDCIEFGPIRNLKLSDIPSKFYIGEVYQASITISPFLDRIGLKNTRFFCDSAVTKALRDILQNSPFHSLLMQVDNVTYAIWQMTSSNVFYFFDGHQNDVDGNRDMYEGSACMFMVGSIDKLCAFVWSRLNKLQKSPKSTLYIHGMKILDLKQLSEKQQKSKPMLRLRKTEYIKPMTPEIAETYQDSPSIVDSFAPVLTSKQILKMQEELSEKSQKPNEVVEEKLSSESITNEFSEETVQLVLGTFSEILMGVVDDEAASVGTTKTKHERQPRRVSVERKPRKCGWKLVKVIEEDEEENAPVVKSKNVVINESLNQSSSATFIIAPESSLEYQLENI